MKRLKQVLKGTIGDTLVEIIVSIVIILASVGIFTTAVAVAGRTNNRVDEMDREMYEAIAEAEARSGVPAESVITITGEEGGLEISIPVDIYGDELKSFSLKEESP